MKRILIVLAFTIVYLTINAQDGPSLEETINYIKARVEKSDTRIDKDLTLMYTDFTFEYYKAKSIVEVSYIINYQERFDGKLEDEKYKYIVSINLLNTIIINQGNKIVITPRNTSLPFSDLISIKLSTGKRSEKKWNEFSIDIKEGFDCNKVLKAFKHLQELEGVKDDSDMF